MPLSLEASFYAKVIPLTTITTVITNHKKENPALGGKTVKAECRAKVAFELC